MKNMPEPRRNKQIRVIIADDHPVVREGLTAIINSQSDMKVVGEAENGRTAIELWLLHRPDVILLDLRMPEMNGIEATLAILKIAPQAKIIILSTYKCNEDVYQSVKAGAKAYLLKDAARHELIAGIRAVYAGQIKLSPEISAQLMAGVTQERLTKRETQIILLVVAGKSNKEIGASLGVTEGTVKIHVGHVFKKLGVGGRTEAIQIAIKRGLVHVSSD